MIIYKSTNLINGKVYIGQSIKTLPKRISGHKATSKKPKIFFHYAIKKYGFENFNWTIIDQAYNREELDDKEIFWIDFYDSRNKDKGYNINEGGNHSLVSEETKIKISENAKHNDNYGMKNKHHSEDVVNMLKVIHLGKKHSKEYKQKQSDGVTLWWKNNGRKKNTIKKISKPRYKLPNPIGVSKPICSI